MSFYLTYRPQKVNELDLDVARKSMQGILNSGKFSHAYLLTGPKGTGKTSSARILAMVLNCIKNEKVSGKLNEPCGECEHCLSVKHGTSLSMIEMDAASNRGIDDIRVLRESIALAPSTGNYVVYVIDEVHMLTTEAFNALLKTLEEPPRHAVFVLCTTEPHKLPETVISRCTRIQFRKASKEEVERSLIKVVEGEKLQVEKGVLAKIAARVDGSFRDGMKILEQLSQKKGKIKGDEVDAITGFSDEYDCDELVDKLLSLEVNDCLEIIKNREELGVDFLIFGKRLVENMRQRFLDKVMLGGKNAAEARELVALADKFSEAVLKIKTAVVAQLPLEIAVVEWCLGEVGREENDRVRTRIDEQGAGEVGIKDDVKNRVKVEKQTDDNVEKKEKSKGETLSEQELNLEMFKTNWGEVLNKVKPHNHSLEALLKAASPQSLNEDWLTIEVFYSFHKEQLEQDRHRKILETVIGEVMRRQVKLRFVLGTKNTKKVSKGEKEVANVTGKVADEALAEAAEEIFG